MNEAVNKVLRMEDISATWRNLGVEATPMQQESFEAFWLSEIKRWSEIARNSKVSLE